MQKRQILKGKDHHVLTVRMPVEDFDHLKRAQARLATGKERRRVTYTEIIVNQIRKLPT